MTLTQQRLGRTGLTVSNICFGTSALGSNPGIYGYAVDEAQSRETLHAIFDSRVNMLDTSNNYGEGRSEARIGAAIRERGGLPQGFVISTKVDREPATNRLTAARVRQSLNESLAALGVDRVQILHLHDPEFCADLTDITQACGALDELFKMKAEGMVELLDPKPLEQLLREVTDHETAQQFYLASRAAVAGDSRTDKSYIAFLRDRLKLDEVEAAEVEQLTR